MAGNTTRDMNPMRDMTAPEWHAADPEAFEAAVYLMNLSADDRRCAKIGSDEEGMSLIHVSRPLGYSISIEDTDRDEKASIKSALLPSGAPDDSHASYVHRRSIDVLPQQDSPEWRHASPRGGFQPF